MTQVLMVLGGWFALSCVCGVVMGRLLRDRSRTLSTVARTDPGAVQPATTREVATGLEVR
ncbi:MAG: hypothetical protein ACE14W_03290 [Candidatus Velamenicoccus archaeovorus]